MTGVIVTGGVGFVGSHLLRTLTERGDDVRVLDLVDVADQPKVAGILDSCDFDYRAVDVRDSAAIDDAIDGAELVFHLASHVGLSHYLRDAEDVADVIFNGTRIVANAALRRGVPMVFTSTSEVFGRNPSLPWPETADCVMGDASRPRWVYATAKMLAEQLLFDLARRRGLRFTTVRLFNVYGPGQDSSFFVTRTLWRLAHGYQPVVLDGGEQRRCFTFIDDAVAALVRASQTPAAFGEAFNIGSTTPISVLGAIDTLAEVAGVDRSGLVPIHRSSRDLYGPNHDEPIARIPDIGKAVRILGWQPSTSLTEGATAMLDWANHRGWWTSDVLDVD
ncbi:SDR family oxidoreductase [Nocardia sp. JMUB6875]|uniref:NAD-dependent epimerase/dehydratase family protein n=1 Tax=Nocardia sp. JMUB6875 TaxID=3158170 RepID=UPI0032E6F69D